MNEKAKLVVPGNFLEDIDSHNGEAMAVMKLLNNTKARAKVLEDFKNSGISAASFERANSLPQGAIELSLMRNDQNFEAMRSVTHKQISLFAKKSAEDRESSKTEYDELMNSSRRLRSYILEKYPAAVGALMEYYNDLKKVDPVAAAGVGGGVFLVTNPQVEPDYQPLPDPAIKDESVAIVLLIAIVIVGAIVVVVGWQSGIND
jgi:hypothetical protein